MKSLAGSAENKQSIIAIGVLMLSLAALQSPLWRSQATGAAVAVHNGGATLLASDRPIAKVALDSSAEATAEVVGDHEVLIRGKALGETQLRVAAKDGSISTYRVVVQSEAAKSFWASLVSR